jgi:hypothetical protein
MGFALPRQHANQFENQLLDFNIPPLPYEFVIAAIQAKNFPADRFFLSLR